MCRRRASTARLIAIVWSIWTASATAAAGATFVYVHDRGTPNQIFGFTVDRDGSLTAVPNSPFVSNDSGGSMTYSATTLAYDRQRHLLVTTGNGGASAWSIAEDGSLSAVSGSPFGGFPLGAAATARVQGRLFVYATVDGLAGCDQLRGFEVLPDDRLDELAPSPFPLSACAIPEMLVRGSTLLVPAGKGVEVFHVEPGGALVPVPGSPFDFGLPLIDADLVGGWLYATVLGGNAHPRRIGSGLRGLASTGIGPFPLPVEGVLFLSVSRRFAFAFAFGKTDVAILPRTRGGSLQLANPSIETVGVNVLAHAADSKGTRLFVAGKTALESYTVEPRTPSIRFADSASIAASNWVNGVVIVRR